MSNISCIIIARNEAENIRRCLRSVTWVNEIVVVDTGSTDDTRAIAAGFTNRIFDLKWQGFGPAKEFARGQATGDWVLSVDADEVVSDRLQDEIKRTISSKNSADGYFIPRRSNFLGRWIRHGGWYPDLVLRLFKRNKGTFTKLPVHEEVNVRGKTGRLKNDLLHFTDPDFDHYLRKLNQYTSLDALQLRKAGRNSTLLDIISRPAMIFLKMYILKGGFLDGMHGLVLAGASAFHVFSKYVKLWHLNRRVGQEER